MQIIFDANKMHVQVLCGILESYQPSENINGIQQKVAELKLKLEEFQKNVIGPEIGEIQKLISEENKKFTKSLE